jgi:S1-C subfamily serine protease
MTTRFPVGPETAGGRRPGLLLPAAACIFVFLGAPCRLRAGAGEGEAAAAATRAGSLEEIVQCLRPWVVSVTVEREEDERGIFSERRLQRLPDEARVYFQRPAGTTSGLLVGAEGLVLTSRYNVAGKLRSIRVRLPTGAAHPARLVARSTVDDLALLRLEPEAGASISFPGPLPWRESGGLRAGQIVLVVGRASEARELTVTRGIVSAVGRNGGRAFQTDAEINYGNIGGAVIDLEGRLLGVACFVGHTQGQWGINSGIGFAANAGTILKILPRLAAGEDIETPFFGVGPPEREESTGSGGGGALVGVVVRESAAAAAGIVPRDVIREFDGVAVADFDHLRRLIFARQVGEAVKLRVARGGEVLELEARIGKRQPEARP